MKEIKDINEIKTVTTITTTAVKDGSTITDTITTADRNEILFWRVFKNIYIFRKIIEKIHTTEWNSYDNYKQISVNNRIKFKYIYSLEWMMVKGQFQLLKYKLKSNAKDEYIEITKSGIISLFMLSTGNDETMVNEFKEIFTLLMKFRKLEMESAVPSLVNLSILYNSLEPFKLLLNEPYNYQILPSTIELIISTGNIDILKLVMDHQQNNSNQIIICEETKLKSLYLASTSKSKVNKMIELILQYPQLYTEHTNQQPSNSEPLLKIQAVTFLSIDSVEIQQKLLNLNCVKLGANTSKFIQTKHDKFDTLERILICFKLFKSSKKDIQIEIDSILNQTKECNKTKELHKLLVLSFKSVNVFYKEYLELYDELIDEMMLEPTKKIAIQYCIDSLSTDLFKFLSPDAEKDWMKLRVDYYKTVLSATRISQFTKEFIKQPHNSHTNFIVDVIVFKIVSSIQSKQDYQLVMESIPVDCKLFESHLPNEWNPLLPTYKNSSNFYNGFLLIQDNETVDWLLKYATSTDNNYEINVYKLIDLQNGRTNEPFPNINNFQFANIEPLVYFIKNSNNNLSPSSPLVDVGKLKLIKLKLLSKQQIMELFNLIKPNDNLNQIDYSFEQFISSALEILCDGNGDGTINLEDIKIQFNSNVMGSYWLLVKYISEYNLNMVEYIIGNFNIKCNLNQFHLVCTEKLVNIYPNGLYEYRGDVCTIKNINYQNIFKLIQLFIGFILDGSNNIPLDTGANGDNSVGDSSVEFKSTIGMIIQFLYDRIIQIQGITIEQVFEIRNLIQPLGMKLKHSVYHSFHYINIKSKKLIKYIMNRPYLKDYSSIQDGGIYDGNDESVDINFQNENEDLDPDQEMSPTFKISSYLKVNEFTFEYLFGSNGNGKGNGASFEEILSKLIHHLSHTPIDQLIPRIHENSDEGDLKLRNNYLTLKLNTDLEYCLDIRRIDLFFQQIQFIQSLYDRGIRVGSFPQIAKIVNPTNIGQSNQTPPYYYFEFSPNVIAKVLVLFDSDSISKLLEFNRNEINLDKLLFGVFLLGSNNSKRTDLLDSIFNNLNIQTVDCWSKLMETNQLYTIEHFVNHYSNDLFEMKSKNNGSKNRDHVVMFGWKLVQTMMGGQLTSICDNLVNSVTLKRALINKCFNNVAPEEASRSTKLSIEDENDNIFTISFSNGFIKLSLLILSNYNCLIFNPTSNDQI